MADIQKRTKKARKQAAKRAATARKDAAKRAKKTRRRTKATAKAGRKAVQQTSVTTRAKAVAGLAVALGAAAAVGKLLKGSGSSEQRYTSEPDHLPNTPDRPAGTTAPVGAATSKTGTDTGPETETERARAEQTS
jgi:hypothetical protein